MDKMCEARLRTVSGCIAFLVLVCLLIGAHRSVFGEDRAGPSYSVEVVGVQSASRYQYLEYKVLDGDEVGRTNGDWEDYLPPSRVADFHNHGTPRLVYGGQALSMEHPDLASALESNRRKWEHAVSAKRFSESFFEHQRDARTLYVVFLRYQVTEVRYIVTTTVAPGSKDAAPRLQQVTGTMVVGVPVPFGVRIMHVELDDEDALAPLPEWNVGFSPSADHTLVTFAELQGLTREQVTVKR